LSSLVTPVNSVWIERVDTTAELPNIGHLLLLFPLNGRIEVDGKILDPEHYLYLNVNEAEPCRLTAIQGTQIDTLVCAISPEFVSGISQFLAIPGAITELLSGIPLPKGDDVSGLLAAIAVEKIADNKEELLMEIVGELLKVQKARYGAMQSLQNKKAETQAELLKRLLKARQFIEASYLKSISNKDIADFAAISEHHFLRLFKAAFAITVHQYIMRLRLNDARRRLEDRSTHITEVALDIGYSSLSAFITAFRNHFGMTPSAYQAKIDASEN
jgi:AraC-like DNA-binding protein